MAKHIPGMNNDIADALSQFQASRFSWGGGTSNPASVHALRCEILIYFVAHCIRVLQLKYSTIKTYLIGIWFTYVKAGFQDPWMLFCKWPAFPVFANYSKSSKEITG